MSYSKVLVSNPAFSVSVSEAAGEAKLVVSIGASAGGGNIAGFAKVAGSIEADVEAKVLIDAGIGLVASKFAGNAMIAAAAVELQALIDAELLKL